MRLPGGRGREDASRTQKQKKTRVVTVPAFVTTSSNAPVSFATAVVPLSHASSSEVPPMPWMLITSGIGVLASYSSGRNAVYERSTPPDVSVAENVDPVETWADEPHPAEGVTAAAPRRASARTSAWRAISSEHGHG